MKQGYRRALTFWRHLPWADCEEVALRRSSSSKWNSTRRVLST